MSLMGPQEIENFLQEDDLYRNSSLFSSLPKIDVTCQLKLKDNLILAGTPFFADVFNFLLQEKRDWSFLTELEGQEVQKEDNKIVEFELPFNIAVSGERLALNLLQRACSVATITKSYVSKMKGTKIEILDTRKTTPGLRNLEKYAVRVGGGKNHRFGQADAFMIKDNHKKAYGGIELAVAHFRAVLGFYTPLVVEIHSLEELNKSVELNIKHVMLDNFSPDEVKKAVEKKPRGMTFEVSGGIRLNNIESYRIDGIDAISIGALTNGYPMVDISLKMKVKDENKRV